MTGATGGGQHARAQRQRGPGTKLVALVRALHLDDPWLASLMTVAFVLRLIFWIYTRRTWEDALITVLHSENFYHGLGLTHYAIDDPKPLHGFTSPISVLVPLLADRFHVGWGLPFLKLCSLLAGPAAVWFGYRIVREYLAPAIHHGIEPKAGLPGTPGSRAAAVLAAGYLAIEHHQILWGMAGMETQLATTILLAAIYFLLAGNTWMSGVMSGFCLLARPDFLLWVVVAAVATTLTSLRRRNGKPIALFAVLVCAVYGPWVVFTTLYYGSPIPNTMVAKDLGYWQGQETVGERLRHAPAIFVVEMGAPLEPTFGSNGRGFTPLVKPLPAVRFLRPIRSYWLEGLCLLAIAIGGVTEVRRRRWRWWPVYAFPALFAAAFILRAPGISEWYVPPFCAVMVLLLAKGMADIAGFLPGGIGGGFSWLLTGAYLAGFAVVLPTTFRAERNIQILVEDRVRMEVGIYLSHTPPDTTIASESLGYIGYYSRRTVYDYPGLSSRKVVWFLKTHKTDARTRELQVFAYVKADYLVLRRGELEYLLEEPGSDFLRTDYRVVKEFAVPMEERKKLFPEGESLDVDFLILKRVSARADF